MAWDAALPTAQALPLASVSESLCSFQVITGHLSPPSKTKAVEAEWGDPAVRD